MSAFIVSKRHIDAMVTAGLRVVSGTCGVLRWMEPAPVNEAAYQRGEPWGPAAIEEANKRRRELTDQTAGRVGAMLMAENAASVNHRYDEEDPEEPYVFARYVKPIEPVAILKAIDCYVYQTCEHPEWESSEAREFCDALRKRMIHQLPGYDAAPWGIEDVDPEPKPEPKGPQAVAGARLIEGSDIVVAAKNIRAELAAAFPGVKFSVRSERFSMGNAIRVEWTDGPTGKTVDAITDKYTEGDFDGSTDSYTYRRDSWTTKYGGAKYVTTSRRHSPAMVQRAIDALVAEYGPHSVPTVEDFESGRAYQTTPLGGAKGSDHWSWQSLIHRKLAELAA